MTVERHAGSAVLFDLDGTLLDTAPDMVAVLHEVQVAEERHPLLYAKARCQVSNGVAGLLRAAFGELPATELERLRTRYLETYASRLVVDTTLFPGMAEVLAQLDARQVPWGIVTNKPARLTEPLLEQLGLRRRCACVVSGDTLAERKPHPRPLLHAMELIDAAADLAIYVGDAERDIAAGRAAGMRTVAALYGYIPPEDDPRLWGADHHVASPAELPGIFAHCLRSRT